jgi:hypothetical protein
MVGKNLVQEPFPRITMENNQETGTELEDHWGYGISLPVAEEIRRTAQAAGVDRLSPAMRTMYDKAMEVIRFYNPRRPSY